MTLITTPSFENQVFDFQLIQIVDYNLMAITFIICEFLDRMTNIKMNERCKKRGEWEKIQILLIWHWIKII